LCNYDLAEIRLPFRSTIGVAEKYAFFLLKWYETIAVQSASCKSSRLISERPPFYFTIGKETMRFSPSLGPFEWW